MTLSQSAQTAQDARDTIQGLLYELERTRNLLYRADLSGTYFSKGDVVCPDEYEPDTRDADDIEYKDMVWLSGSIAPSPLKSNYQRLAAKARELVG